MQKQFACLSIALLLMAFGCLGIGQPQAQPQQNGSPAAQPQENASAVGGGADEHGCLGSAGYTWCALKSKCLRLWEEKCEVMLPAGAALNIMPESACTENKGRVVLQVNESIPCSEGEIPLAEIYSETGEKKFCCRSIEPMAPQESAELPPEGPAPSSPAPPVPEGQPPQNATAEPAAPS